MKKLFLLMLFLISIYPLFSQEVLITGTVRASDTGEPIPGVNVIVKGTTKGTITDFDGNYSLKAQQGTVLQFSYIGFEEQEVILDGKTTIDVALTISTSQLDEVVVVGYGTQKKINLTGAVSQITSERIENRPVGNIGQALQGVIPNLNISFADGSPNTNPSYNIRGGTSFSGGNFSAGSPLILVDGVEMDINLLNPDDIKSISVLKDAASSAIYGARAAFGVILVTTKNGEKNRKTRVTYNESFQWNMPSALPDQLDAYTIQEALIAAEGLQGKTASSDMYEKLGHIKAYMDNPAEAPIYYMDGNEIIWVGNTDVYNLALRKSSPMNKRNLTVSGGGENNTYYVSLGYQNQDGLYRINTDKFKRYNVMLNVSSSVNDWLGLDYKVSYNASEYKEPVNPSAKGGWWSAMNHEAFRNVNMPLRTPEDSPVGEMYTDNILSFMDYGSSDTENKELLLLNVMPKVKLSENWNIKGNFSYKSYNGRNKAIVPELRRIDAYWDAPTNAHTNPSYISESSTHSNQFTLNVFTDYTFNTGKHTFYALAGYNQEWYNLKYLYGKGQDLLSENIHSISQTLGNEYASDSMSEWALRGGFYRVTYSFDDKYLIESNGRYDGTSRFPKESRFAFFPSVSAGWRVSEENFAKFMKPVVNQLKFRASYGSLGNQNVNNYIYVPSYGTTSQINYILGGIRPVGITPPGLVDPNITWETATTIDFGLDASLFNNRLDLVFDWYSRETTDILVDGDKYPATIGTSAPTQNSGAMKTNGWGLTMKWRDQLSNGLRYDVTFNLSDYTSKIESFNGNPEKLLSSLYEGQRMGEIWGFETAGIYQTEQEIENAPDQSKINSGIWYPGDVRYTDLDGDGEISYGSSTVEDSGDRKIIGNSTPRYQFGVNMNLFWKNFDFNIFFQGVAKRDYWIGNSMYWGNIVSSSAIGTKGVYENSWTPERTTAHFPAYKTKSANALTQTAYLQDASYIRLKNIAIGYTLPVSVSEKMAMERLRFSISAFNIWEHTDIPDILDPEEMDPHYPMIRSFAFSLQATF